MAEQSPPDFIEANDEAFEDEGAGLEDGQSSLTSLASSILRGVEENGRRYATYGKEEPMMPMDEREMDRVDMSHAKYFLLLDKQRYLAPIPEDTQRVLDLGCGTGIWSIDFADEHPAAEVVGVDIAPIQPQWVPPNARFEIDDVEADWTWKSSSFDYIFSRDLLFIRDWPKLINQSFEHLKPGGYIEFQSVCGLVGCDDGSLPADCAFSSFDYHVNNAANNIGAPIDAPCRFKKLFEKAGFEDVVEKVYKIPCNPWAKDPRYRLIGAFELENFMSGLEGMVLRVFEKGLGWSAQETHVFVAKVREDFKNPRFHTYYPFYVVYGRKPLAAGS